MMGPSVDPCQSLYRDPLLTYMLTCHEHGLRPVEVDQWICGNRGMFGYDSFSIRPGGAVMYETSGLASYCFKRGYLFEFEIRTE